MILAGDIGGTKTTLALYSEHEASVSPLNVRHYCSQDYPHFFAILDSYLKEASQAIQKACFSVAGPVFTGHCEILNLPWILDADKIAQRYFLKKVSLLNDLEATAYGVLVAPDTAKILLNEDMASVETMPVGNCVVIAPGTGLGEALMYWDGVAHHPLASEGGHADFAPRNDFEMSLLQFLLKKHQHVSYERVLSGPGLLNIYELLKSSGRCDEPAWLAERLREEDPSAVISDLALSEKSDLCLQALHCFVSLLGAEAGNLALKGLATGGVYVGGGIAPKILPKLKDGTFMASFIQKGRYTALLKKIPVWVIQDPKTALHGAAYALMNDGSHRQPCD